MDTDHYDRALNIFEGIVLNSISINEIIGFIAIFFLLITSALISGSEVAFFSLSPKQISDLKKLKTGKSNTLLGLLEKPKKLIATILITNNFVNVSIVIISTFITNSLIDFTNAPLMGFLFQVVVITFVLLFFGEILPKIYSSQFNFSFALFATYPLKFFSNLTSPLANFLAFSTSIVDKRLANKKKSNISMDDISHALDLTNDAVLKEDEKILKGIVNFGNIGVNEIMRARVDVVSIDISYSFNKLISVIIESGYSRIPVVSGTFDSVKGILYTKDLLPHYHKGDLFRWQSLIRPPYYVPETKKINDLLEEFQQRKIHLAVVIDEYGGSSGIITMEDILEEIVGEITDEYDQEDELFVKIDENHYIFEAKILLNDFSKILNIDENVYELEKGDADTLAGLILELKGEIPKKNETIFFKNFEFKIKSADSRRIKQVELKIINL